MAAHAGIYAFEQSEVDLNRRELRTNGTVVPLGGRAFDLVEVLVRAAGRLVTKDELMAEVWRGAVVEENTIQVHVSALRRALGSQRGLLRTSSGRGYRLLGNWTTKPDSAPMEASLAAPQSRLRGNLPVAASDLIGREPVLRHLRDVLSAYRIVTLTGPGGIGKTRLALAVAHGHQTLFDGAVWLVELVSLVDPALAPSAVTSALGLEVRGGLISAEVVARAIGDRRLLLVLDNCEHLIDATARLAETLLRMCPQVTVLATSREVLQIDGEYAFRVAPLDIPSSQSADPLPCSAVQLFIARLRALSSDLALRQHDVQTIAAICRRLDGIPLAIEFAAARAATLGLEQTLSRLDDRFALLTGGRRTALPRHQTLRATLDWSYALLPEAEQQMLRRAAIFTGGFTLDAAASVIGEAGGPASHVLDGIISLVSKSLLGFETSDQVSRWRLLETTRAYALEKLIAGGEATELARRHATFFSKLLAPLDLPAGSQPEGSRIAAIVRDIDNIRAALDWAFAPGGDEPTGIALTTGAVPLWVHLSLMGECRGRVERALAALDGDLRDDPRARMQLNAALGWSLMFAVGRARETSQAWSTTLELAMQLGDTGFRLRALWGLWVDDLNNGLFRRAADLARAFAAIAAESSELIDRMMADRMLATSLHFLGDQTNARLHIERMLRHYAMPALDGQILRFQFDQRVTARYFQARIMWLQGFADQARQVVESNVEEARSVGNALSLASALGQGACPIALFTGDWAAAERYGAMLLDHAERHALKLWAAWARSFNAVVMVRRGRIADGLDILSRELEQAGESRSLPRYMILVGELAAALGQAGAAERGLESVDRALARCEANEELWYLPELLRIRGDLLVHLPGGTAIAAAQEHYLRAIDRARQQGALAWEFRSGISLARLQGDHGRSAEARTGLLATFRRFTEGFDTLDLVAARQILDEPPDHDARSPARP